MNKQQARKTYLDRMKKKHIVNGFIHEANEKTTDMHTLHKLCEKKSGQPLDR